MLLPTNVPKRLNANYCISSAESIGLGAPWSCYRYIEGVDERISDRLLGSHVVFFTVNWRDIAEGIHTFFLPIPGLSRLR